jgi:hypothetical protein
LAAALALHAREKEAAQGVNDAPELSQHSVAGVLDNVSAVFADLGVDQDTQMLFQSGVRWSSGCSP